MVVLEEWQVVLTVPAAMADEDAAALAAEVDGLLRGWAERLVARLEGPERTVGLLVERAGSG